MLTQPQYGGYTLLDHSLIPLPVPLSFTSPMTGRSILIHIWVTCNGEDGVVVMVVGHEWITVVAHR